MIDVEEGALGERVPGNEIEGVFGFVIQERKEVALKGEGRVGRAKGEGGARWACFSVREGEVKEVTQSIVVAVGRGASSEGNGVTGQW